MHLSCSVILLTCCSDVKCLTVIDMLEEIANTLVMCLPKLLNVDSSYSGTCFDVPISPNFMV